MTTLPNFKFLISHPAHFFALGFGSGLSKKAPGTIGSLVGIPFYLLIATEPITSKLSILFLMFVMGVYLCDITGKNIGIADHGSIVWDEIVAVMLVLVFTPHYWTWWGIAFVLFRLFDIWKPFPIRQCDAKLKGGFGVMFDDLLAAIYAITILKVLAWITLVN